MFKAGDKVLCIDAQGTELIADEVYTVAYDHTGYLVSIQGVFDHSWDEGDTKRFDSRRFKLYDKSEELMVEDAPKTIDSHYNFTYNLTQDDVDNGYIKLDPYFVADQWKLGDKDNSGVLFHCFKTIARFGDKNDVEREVKALHLQIKRLAEIRGVKL